MSDPLVGEQERAALKGEPMTFDPRGHRASWLCSECGTDGEFYMTRTTSSIALQAELRAAHDGGPRYLKEPCKNTDFVIMIEFSVAAGEMWWQAVERRYAPIKKKVRQ